MPTFARATCLLSLSLVGALALTSVTPADDTVSLEGTPAFAGGAATPKKSAPVRLMTKGVEISPSVTGTCHEFNKQWASTGTIAKLPTRQSFPKTWGTTDRWVYANGSLFWRDGSLSWPPAGKNVPIRLSSPRGGYIYANAPVRFTARAWSYRIDWANPPAAQASLWQSFARHIVFHEGKHYQDLGTAVQHAQGRWNNLKFRVPVSSRNPQAALQTQVARQYQRQQKLFNQEMAKLDGVLDAAESADALACGLLAWYGTWTDPYGDHPEHPVGAVSCTSDPEGLWAVYSDGTPAGPSWNLDALLTKVKDRKLVWTTRPEQDVYITYESPFLGKFYLIYNTQRQVTSVQLEIRDQYHGNRLIDEGQLYVQHPEVPPPASCPQ